MTNATFKNASEQTLRTMRRLYPELDSESLNQAAESFTRYVEIVTRIYDRIKNDPVEYARFKALTAAVQRVRMKAQTDSTPLPE